MTKEIEIRQAMHLIWRNLPNGPTTFSKCNCGRQGGRGGGPCLLCAEEELARVSGFKIHAEGYVNAVKNLRQIEAQLLEGDEE